MYQRHTVSKFFCLFFFFFSRSLSPRCYHCYKNTGSAVCHSYVQIKKTKGCFNDMKKTTGLVKNGRTGYRDVCEKIFDFWYTLLICIHMCTEGRMGETSCIMHHNHTQRFANWAIKEREYQKQRICKKVPHQNEMHCVHAPLHQGHPQSAHKNIYWECSILHCTNFKNLSFSF